MEEKQNSTFRSRNQSVHPKTQVSILSKIFFCWTFPLFVKGLKKDLNEEDLYGPLEEYKSGRLGDALEKAWSKEQIFRQNPSLWRALFKVFYKELAMYGLMVATIECLKMSQPLFIGKLMEYYTPNHSTMDKSTAFMYAGGIIFISFCNVLLGHSYMLGLQHLGMKIRIACCSLIYRKALRLSKSALVDTTVGQMVNLLSNDVKRFDMAVKHIHIWWVTPLEITIVVYLLYSRLGLSSLFGIVLFLLFIPLQMYLGKRTSVYRLKTALKTDQRLRLMNEIISGIHVIKMYTWEKPFAKLVEVARKLEMKQIKETSRIRALNMSFTIFLNRVAIFLCVLMYVLTGNTLQSKYVYVVTSFYGILRQCLTVSFSQAATTLAESKVSVKRIQTFLMKDEIESVLNNHIRNDKGITEKNEVAPISQIKSEIGIQLKQASVKWTSSSPDHILDNVTVNVGVNELVAIVGPVGSGKTTLLHVILKELNLIKGTLDLGGSISYASQEPWLFGGSIRQNILFGETLDIERYRRVVKVCTLERDFGLFPYGDRTLVGERGAMLSGGQKSRINLARAIYKNADIYLLDDPLSAVDTHVGKQIFDECIVGFLRGKCVVLVTHQLQYLKAVNRIYLLNSGKVKISGTYKKLMESDDEFLKSLGEDLGEDNETKFGMQRAKSLKSLMQVESPVKVKEQRKMGTISGNVYISYLQAGGNILTLLLIALLFVIAQFGASGTDYFLNFWVNLEQDRLETWTNTSDPEIKNRTQFPLEYAIFTSEVCLSFYSTLIIFVVVLTIIRSLSAFEFCMKASRNLHNLMFSKIVYTSMRFFNVNSSGRILNRFSKDMGSTDEALPFTLIDTIQIGMIAVSVNIVVGVVNPWILISSAIIFALFYVFRIIYLATSRDVKRIEATSRSPVFTHLAASLYGLTTIRAFGAQNILRDEFDQHQDLHSSAFYMFLVCSKAFGFWLDLHCVVYVGLVTFSFLFMERETYGGNVGLGITQSITLTGMLQWGMRQWGELENQMTSVERVVEYTEVNPEPDDEMKKPTTTWPTQGNIEFRSVSMQYAIEEPFVLKKLTFKINSAEKIGIVGRTGAGKSSLISALFRLTNIEGSVLIDGIDTQKISLKNLRSKISIIPQEPILFSGTLRKNLDPFDEYNDEVLWNALEEVELKCAILDLPSGLHANVSEGGINFSVGQRQLLCLARAIIRRNKILVLDEATASVDPQTDDLIQATIRKKFKDCTVLTIAHRLHTVMDSDKVLVMEAGQAVEFDHPHLLLQNTSSIFYGLVKQTGKGMAGNLLKIAMENYVRMVDGSKM